MTSPGRIPFQTRISYRRKKSPSLSIRSCRASCLQCSAKSEAQMLPSQFATCRSFVPSRSSLRCSRGWSTHRSIFKSGVACPRQQIAHVRIPTLFIHRLYPALETLTEPHRLTATMNCIVSVGPMLVKGGPEFPEGPCHVVPLLKLTLPGIDPNDIKKCMVCMQLYICFGHASSRLGIILGCETDLSLALTGGAASPPEPCSIDVITLTICVFWRPLQVTFQFISTFCTLIHLVDCSEAVFCRDDLTEVCISVLIGFRHKVPVTRYRFIA